MASTRRRSNPPLDVDALLADRSARILVSCGAGGVGKTTIAAALALRAAERHGRNAVVLTIDPARRLAQSMGLVELDNTPRPVPEVDGASGGELHAMMLDMKRTFDEVVSAHATPEKAAEIFANPFYQAMSSTFSGTQEYMAMEKLSQLRARDEWDLIVVDTPPSRSALDFLDAPQRMTRFLDGRMLKMLTPARSGTRRILSVATVSLGIFGRAINKILGTQLITDVSAFVGALEEMFGGFRERAERTYEVLQAPETAFVVVAAPEPDAIREAAYFAGRLVEQDMPLAGFVLNRAHAVAAPALSAEDALAGASRLNGGGSASGPSPSPVTAAVLRLHADLVRRTQAEHRVTAEFTGTHPEVPMVRVPAQPEDIHDLAALRLLGTALAA